MKEFKLGDPLKQAILIQNLAKEQYCRFNASLRQHLTKNGNPLWQLKTCINDCVYRIKNKIEEYEEE